MHRIADSPQGIQHPANEQAYGLLTTTDPGALPVAYECDAVPMGIRSAAAAI